VAGYILRVQLPADSSPRPWELADDQLLAQCRVDTYTSSGPGGQRRNKTAAAVRITHQPTGITSVATDSRSQRENRIHALRTLRLKLALELRRDIDDRLNYRPPPWLAQYPKLHINPSNPLYPAMVAEVLDVLKASHWSMSTAAVTLGQTSSALTRFLSSERSLWAKVNQCRSELGMKPLGAR
jgi:hypothetical protein